MQSTITQKTIHGYLVELENDPEVEWSDCWIMKDGFSSSLIFLQDTGELLHDVTGETIEVSPGTIEAIAKWAEKHGY
jgi:hypothetical protein